MLGGYAGKALWVDLSARRVEDFPLDEGICKDFIGGYGLGARIIYSHQEPRLPKFHPDEILAFVTGPLTGTLAPFGSRFMVVGRSPLTETWGDSNCGGFFGPYLKFAGYDAVFIRGASADPVSLLIDDAKAQIIDARQLWGLDTHQTDAELKRLYGSSAHAATIGPAAEKRSLIAAIITDRGRAAGRSGLAALAGAKKLKAVIVRGKRRVPVARADKVAELREEYLGRLNTPLANLLHNFGTCGTVVDWIKNGAGPVKNWAGAGTDDFPGLEAIGGDAVIEREYKKYGCYGCTLRCGGFVSVKSGLFQSDGHKPEYETLAAFGSLCLNDNLESIVKANDVCNRLGLDTMSAGSVVAFAIECFENGIVSQEEADGLRLTWGNADAIVALTERIGRREGFGAVLADGVKVAAERIGRGSEEFAIHVHGQEVSMRDPRFAPGYATVYKLDATPARHTQGGAHRLEGANATPGLPAKPLRKYEYTGKAEGHRVMSHFQHSANCTGLCSFGFLTLNAQFVPEMLSAVTGRDVGIDEILVTGERIANLRHAFNLREGLNPLEFKLPGRIIGHPPLDKGPLAGVQIDVDTQVREYLKAMAWDPVTARPSHEKLMSLGLEIVARDFGDLTEEGLT